MAKPVQQVAPSSPGPLWWYPQAVLVARERLAAAQKEKRALVQRAREWMADDVRRTVGEANAYIGIDRLDDDVRAARRALMEALDTLAQHSGPILAMLGKE